MGKNNTKIENLISGGLIGAAFGAFLLKNKHEGAIVGALIGSAINSTLIASEEAKKTNVPVCFEENGKLYEIYPNGEKRFIGNVEKPQLQFSADFTLK